MLRQHAGESSSSGSSADHNNHIVADEADEAETARIERQQLRCWTLGDVMHSMSWPRVLN